MARVEFFLLNSVTPKETKGGKAYCTFQAYERGGKVWQVMYWEKGEGLKGGDIVKMQVEESEYNGTLQLTALQCRKVKPEDKAGDIDEYLPKTPYNIDALLDELCAFIEKVKHLGLKQLLCQVAGDPRWRRAAAAKTVHHAYVGGLLEHTVRMCRLAEQIVLLYNPRLDLDLLLTGCILHDMGKMEELTSTASIEYTVEGELLGHITIGIRRADRLMDNWPEVFGTPEEPTELRLRVLHMIGTHHGQVQYGAIKPPATLEANVLVKIDGLDAELGAIFAVFDAAPANATWTQKVKWEQRYYIGERPAEKTEENF